MKQKRHHAEEFEARISRDGSLIVPEPVVRTLGLKESEPVSVRIVAKNTADLLKGKGIAEEEIERIASCQMEATDQVLTFLLSEGILSDQRRRLSRVKH